MKMNKNVETNYLCKIAMLEIIYCVQIKELVLDTNI